MPVSPKRPTGPPRDRAPKRPTGPPSDGAATALRAGAVSSGGALISWRAHGEPAEGATAEPVLMIMGLATSSRGWYRLLPHLSRERTCVVFDNRGTGDSDRPRGLLSMADLAGDALAVMDAAGLGRPHVLGASMGGMIAQHLALAHPDRVRSLTLLCTHPGGGGGSTPRALAALLLRPLFGARTSARISAPAMYSARTRFRQPERMAADLERRLEDSTSGMTVVAQMAAIVRHDTRARLGEVRAPTLVVHGTEDGLVASERGRELADRIPGARLVLLPDAGHMLTTDAEEETVAAIGGFLEENDT